MIKCLATNSGYIGSAVDYRTRISSHFSTLNKGTHPNPHLQRTYNKYPNTFVIGIIKEVPKSELRKEEALAILGAKIPLLNIADVDPMNLTIRTLPPNIAEKRAANYVEARKASGEFTSTTDIQEICKLGTMGWTVSEVSSLFGGKNIFTIYKIWERFGVNAPSDSGRLVLDTEMGIYYDSSKLAAAATGIKERTMYEHASRNKRFTFA